MAEISLQEYMQEIDEAIERGHYEEALAHGRHVLQHYPKHLATYRLLGKAMLEAGQDSLAEDMFRRVLSGDPEDFVARVGMSIICDRQGDLQRAIWHIERAFELSPNNEAIQGELRRLRARRDGVEPSRAELTRGGLARLYMRGNLLPRAIEEFRAILAEEPGRVDLRVALAEALWRNEQRVQAEEVCLQVLDELPYCLKANLILGEIWARSGRDEGWTYLQRAEALDPENRGAAELLGDASPLEPREVHLPHLEYVPPTTAEERPAWMVAAGVEATPAEEERALVDIEAAMGGRIEIPAWLEEIGAGEEETPVAEEEVHTVEGEGIAVPDWLLDQAAEAQMAEGVPSQAPAPEEEIPEWLRDIGEAAPTPPAVEQPTPAEEQPPEIAGEGPVPAEIPDWLREVAPPEAAEEKPPEPPLPAEIPDWLREMAPTEMREEPGAVPVPPVAPEGLEAEPQPPAEGVEIPGWPAEAAAQPPARAAEEGIPDWLAEEAQMPIEREPGEGEAAPPAEEEKVPSWLEGEGLPSGDEALAWLESLAAGKEEELRAAAEAEGEARMAEIMGRPREEAAPTPVEPVVPEAEEAPPPPKMPAEAEAPEVPVPEVPEWLLMAAAPEVPVPPAEPVPPQAPEPLEEPVPPEVPRAEVPPAEPEAFGWTAFGAEETPAEPVAVVPEAAPPEEGFGWTEFEREIAPPVEEAPIEPIEEIGIPEWEPPPAEIVPAEAPPPSVEEAAGVAEAEVVPEMEPPAEGLESLREYVRAHPRDHKARLALARELWQAGLYAESMEAYARILRSNKWVKEIVADVETCIKDRPSDLVVRRVLGDAYMRAGRLTEALKVYREALESL